AELAAGAAPDFLAEDLLSCEQMLGPSSTVPPAVMADVPAEVADIIASVIRYAKLWPREQRDVREELAAHFRDGLANGASADELIAGFGNLRNVARLIRRAKLRNRPLAYRAFRRFSQTVAVA